MEGNYLETRLIMSSSPHIKHKDTTAGIMRDVIIALIPACLAGIYFFGFRSLSVLAVTIAASVISEFLCRKMMKREQTVQDLSAVVTGMLLGLNLPPEIPLWIAAIGAIVAICIVKQLFGGIGQNFMNPALTARVMLLLAWPVEMTKFLIPEVGKVFGASADAVSEATAAATGSVDAVVSATPLHLVHMGDPSVLPSYLDMFLGSIGGCIGETSALALIIGALYLLFRRIISLEIPLTFIGTVAFFTWMLGGQKMFTGDALFNILAGGLFLGAFFMATDYSTSPDTRKGKIIMGFGCGLITSIIRMYAGYPEGVSFAILLMNIITPLIDRYTIPRSFGGAKSVA